MKKLFDFDVTLKDLDSLSQHPFDKVQVIMTFLKTFWFERSGGSNPEYWDRVRVGTIQVFLDDDNHLHLDFHTRFSLTNYPKITEILEELRGPETLDI
jgi:hypothetical protein